MNKLHRAYLSLGSNIEPEYHLTRAIELLLQHGKLDKISTAWESPSVGAPGPNYLNACVLLATPLQQTELKDQVLLPVESQLGRRRSANRFAPRTMDIDIVLFDDESCNDKYWEQAFVVVPLAEIYPGYQHPSLHEPISQTATRLRQNIWMETRPNVLRRFNTTA